MKTIKKASLLFASLALVLGAGLVGNSDTKEVKAAEGTWKRVTDASTLVNGDQILLASESNSAVNGALSGKFLSKVAATFSNGEMSSVPTNAAMITLEGDTASGWYFKLSDKYLYSTGEKTMASSTSKTSAVGSWTISVSSTGDATISYGKYGKILYNVQSPRFLNYTSSTNTAMLLPQIYKFVEKDTIDKFVDDWAKLRAKGGEDGICHFLTKDTRAELDALIARYNAFSAEDQATIGSKADGGTTIANTIEYVSALLAKLDNNSSTGASGVVITSNNSYDKTSLIALFAILGIVTISGYYIIEKKKFSK